MRDRMSGDILEFITSTFMSTQHIKISRRLDKTSLSVRYIRFERLVIFLCWHIAERAADFMKVSASLGGAALFPLIVVSAHASVSCQMLVQQAGSEWRQGMEDNSV